MRCEFFLIPKYRSDVFGEKQNITRDVLTPPKISLRRESSQWSFGFFVSDILKLELQNVNNVYSDDHPDSVFKGGINGARLEISLDGVVFWHGIATEKGYNNDFQKQKVIIPFRSPDAILNEISTNFTIIRNGQTISQAIASILSFEDLSDFPLIDSINSSIVISDVSSLIRNNNSSKGVIQELLRAIDGILTFRHVQQDFLLFDRSLGYDDGVELSKISKCFEIRSKDSGHNQIFNRIVINEVNSWEIARSILAFGLRPINLEIAWVSSVPILRLLALNIIEKLSFPRERIVVVIPAVIDEGEIIPPLKDIFIGKILQCHFSDEIANQNVYGNTTFGSLFFERANRPAVSGVYYIDQISYDLAYDLIEIAIRKRI